jgi:hypothetical protein
MVKVSLRGRFGYGRPRVYYGPGKTDVPEGLAKALGLTPMPEPKPVRRKGAPAGEAETVPVALKTKVAKEG